MSDRISEIRKRLEAHDKHRQTHWCDPSIESSYSGDIEFLLTRLEEYERIIATHQEIDRKTLADNERLREWVGHLEVICADISGYLVEKGDDLSHPIFRKIEK